MTAERYLLHLVFLSTKEIAPASMPICRPDTANICATPVFLNADIVSPSIKEESPSSIA